MQKQALRAQKGEIEFRKRLVSQQVEGKMHFKDEFSSQEIEAILLDRIKKTREQMEMLEKQNILLSPYVELGAERCQRSLVMDNELGLSGAATDLSFDMLKSCGHYRNVFHFGKNPIRICCDVHYLPFSRDSLPFVFCYQFLHHFPDPGIVLKEVYRVLARGGYFFFDEEPYKKVLHIDLYNRKVYAKESLHAGRIRKWIDCFFSRELNNEEGFGIVENDAISLGTWKRALGIFAKKEVTIKTLRNIGADLYKAGKTINYLLAYLAGGVISGLCQKEGHPADVSKPVGELLICPSCLAERKEIPLTRKEGTIICGSCRKRYPIKEDIAFLFPYNTFEELYPEVFRSVARKK
ncbi:MAG: methyltransferase domain-containing protein [Chitinispirillaceae bacterium]|nr:methyltransferase domain-containing protein [Chitinispirillaceae bacterium]